MNTLEFNKKCADFLHWKNLNDESFPEYLNLKSEFYPLKKLLFDSDWNWIMDVIENINKIENPKSSNDTTFSTLKFEIHSLLKTINKKIICKAIDNFIDWYNLNK